MKVNIHEAKTQLSRLLAAVEAGEDVVISRAGRPVARLVPVRDSSKARRLGGYENSIQIADDFDAPLPNEIVDLFYK